MAPILIRVKGKAVSGIEEQLLNVQRKNRNSRKVISELNIHTTLYLRISLWNHSRFQ